MFRRIPGKRYRILPKTFVRDGAADRDESISSRTATEGSRPVLSTEERVDTGLSVDL